MCHPLLLEFVVNLWRKLGEREDEIELTVAKAETREADDRAGRQWPHWQRLPTAAGSLSLWHQPAVLRKMIWKLPQNRRPGQTTIGHWKAVLRVTPIRNKYKAIRFHCQATWNSVLFDALAAFASTRGSTWPLVISKYWNQSLRARICYHWVTNSVEGEGTSM